MPFVTEELWQRLPRREGDKTRTIMLARYPEAVRSLFTFFVWGGDEILMGVVDEHERVPRGGEGL